MILYACIPIKISTAAIRITPVMSIRNTKTAAIIIAVDGPDEEPLGTVRSKWRNDEGVYINFFPSGYLQSMNLLSSRLSLGGE